MDIQWYLAYWLSGMINEEFGISHTGHPQAGQMDGLYDSFIIAVSEDTLIPAKWITGMRGITVVVLHQLTL